MASWVRQLVLVAPWVRQLITPNLTEAEVLCGFELRTLDDIKKLAGYFLNIGIKNVFITMDQNGVYFNNGFVEGLINGEGIQVINETGARDSFVAGIIYGCMNQLKFIDTVKFAYSMSLHTLTSNKTVNPNIQVNSILESMNNEKWDIKFFK